MSKTDFSQKLRSQYQAAVQSSSLEVQQGQQGWVESVMGSVVTISGLKQAQYYELLRFEHQARGMVVDITPTRIRAVLLEKTVFPKVRSAVTCTGQLVSVPVSEQMLGRLLDPLGNALDGGPALVSSLYYPVERDASPMFERELVQEQLYTGIKVIDALFPVGKGQRELILGDPATGKTTLVLDTILNQQGKDVICVYVAIGQKKQAVLDVWNQLQRKGAMDYTVLICATADDYEGTQFIAPYAGTAVAEFFLDRGQDVLIVYDDLSKHAYTWQTISLLLKRPPGREAFPGDIFYVHSRLLERACNLANGGSLTALPIVETQAGRLSSYIPTNLISITDGQINLDTGLFNINQRPAVDIGRSVSRIGGKAQLPAFRSVAEHLRLDYAQFLELEVFTRLGVRVMGETAQILERGQRLRALLKQSKHAPLAWEEQVLIFWLLNAGFLDAHAVERVSELSMSWVEMVRQKDSGALQTLLERKNLSTELEEQLLALAQRFEEGAADVRYA
ncbi:F0F1 ATP synthase subunit alpha [bacterium (Candidatus Blackallbacteria) CG17_big_fil_post_rev_8_21_14_2_50_48_46]|uniref:ATP synthase subunit alpha n=1 Tax=bacterium (Candidatus Blackallbacteria) CG17_big_fil_post_rev_8_21_14_2_50_48_46 TaxID=2014261 RepID=A0A2M7G134_9BACT|nr:MAG: F0F1 ATP synthase subunit alpha [bacterium (Candidatus Blackallbacteria) CG18_big_fil_WC_8_21_14_2_50_49_26]PIW15356.1 MAG: F0F1 ATP synthase subunit alpha [bacterium (Candidatus Blackallbacteria) CG17_big_fil_post_rev_8_21_14_2_50_48_46]PIW49783.1 MAG: F0F1 ATP synthase subunit alpha [bacterium (Candidatus Blackallbacteria) CG13_big_fil_rev_8_21_14_2_50_49_14]